MARRRYTILLSDEALAELPRVVAELRAAGLVVGDVQELIGTVSGEADEADGAALQRVAGVQAVEGDRTVAIPPPDAPVQ